MSANKDPFKNYSFYESNSTDDAKGTSTLPDFGSPADDLSEDALFKDIQLYLVKSITFIWKYDCLLKTEFHRCDNDF